MASRSDEEAGGEETRAGSSHMEEAEAPSTTADAAVEGARALPTTAEGDQATAMEEDDEDDEEDGEEEEDEEVVAVGASANQQGQAGMQSLKGVLRELEEVEGMLGKVRAACGGGAMLSSTPAVSPFFPRVCVCMV